MIITQEIGSCQTASATIQSCCFPISEKFCVCTAAPRLVRFSAVVSVGMPSVSRPTVSGTKNPVPGARSCSRPHNQARYHGDHLGFRDIHPFADDLWILHGFVGGHRRDASRHRAVHQCLRKRAQIEHRPGRRLDGDSQISARACPAQAGRLSGQPQETVSTLPGREACSPPPWRRQARHRNPSPDDGADGSERPLIARLRVGSVDLKPPLPHLPPWSMTALASAWHWLLILRSGSARSV